VTVRIALATCAAHPDLHEDDFPLADVLRAAGVNPVAEVWTDPSVDWSSYDGVVLRSVWDYHQRYDEFTGWLDLLDKGGVQVFNDTDLICWNADKRYLLDLRERGVAIVPSQVAAGACLREVVAGLTGQEIVIKPTVSASAHHTIRGVAGSAELDQALAELPDAVYLVQPFQPEIATDGEWSLIYLGGTYSHTVVKRPAAGDYRVQHEYGGSAELVDPPTAVREAAEAALAAAPARTAPTYARVDGILSAGRFLLMELELIEPYLFLPDHPPATDRLAAVVADRLTTGCPS
jgi:glutathione synthase/RimK-type ligase-like ATP-grasp enzyme